MEENIEEENLIKSLETESENSQNDITPIQALKTINSTKETENMEVHHHAHNPAEQHNKKNWKSYFWEFLMLFLAVFCGFLAEYQLEHKIEGDREIVYIESMIEDLKMDTTNLGSVIEEFKQNDICIDTILKMYPKLSDGYNDTLHRNLRTTHGFPDFIYSDRTMQQLKNAGALRLLRNKKVVDGIVSYDSDIRDLNDVDIPLLLIDYEKYCNLRRELFDYQNLKIDEELKSIPQMENGNKNYLLKSDKESLGIFYNNLLEIQGYYKGVTTKEIDIKKKATELITLIKKEYNLNND
jgi:hypothetical protein